jgi:serine/threonine protein kinase
MDKINSQFVNNLVKKYKVNKILNDDLKLIGIIGEGQEGKVYQGYYNNEKIAFKQIDEMYDKKCLEYEIAILQNISHKCIPKLYGIVVEDSRIGLVLQLIEGKTLSAIPIKLLKHDKKVEIVKKLCCLLEFIHSKNLIHRDIKPENILITFNTNSLELYLIDYGISRVTQHGILETRSRGTTYYLAPENLDATGFTDSDDIISTINNKVDVWSYGCLVSYLFSGILPWINECDDEESAIISNLLEKNPFPIPSNIKDETIIEIISKATIIDPKERYTMSELKFLVDSL